LSPDVTMLNTNRNCILAWFSSGLHRPVSLEIIHDNRFIESIATTLRRLRVLA
jgi:hypothetical protein